MIFVSFFCKGTNNTDTALGQGYSENVAFVVEEKECIDSLDHPSRLITVQHNFRGNTVRRPTIWPSKTQKCQTHKSQVRSQNLNKKENLKAVRGLWDGGNKKDGRRG